MINSFKRITAAFTGFLLCLIVGIAIATPITAHAEGGRERNKFSPSKQKAKKSPRKKKVKKSTRRKKITKKPRIKKFTKKVPLFRRRQLLVTFRANIEDGSINAIAKKYKLRKITDTNNFLINQRIVKFSLKSGLSSGVLQQLINENTVTSAQPNFLYTLAAQRSVQYASKILQMPIVHTISKGDGVTITILDSGVFSRHPAIKGFIAQKFDAVGRRAIGNTNHGTSIASIIVAHGKLTGLAPNSRLLSARVFASDRRGAPMVAETYNLMRAIDWAAKQKSAIINMSFAGPKDTLFHKAITAAHDKGIALVASVGNQGPAKPVAYPAAYKQVVAVTATGRKNQLYRFANRGSQIALSAPGVNILVARHKRSYGFMTGTSAAAAYVSASLALVLQLQPNLEPNQATNSLTKFATDLGTKGHDKSFGYGLLNVYSAIRNDQ